MVTTAVDPQMEIVRRLKERMELLKVSHPLWHNEFEDVDPMTADREHVEELLRTAPNEWAEGLIGGIMLFRQQLSIVTDREF